MMKSVLTAIALLLALTAEVSAGVAEVVEVEAVSLGNGEYRFAVTVRHGDEGWHHYADKWEVLAPDGTVLATRTLLHPHVEEQPFTRGLAGVLIPENIREVSVRAHDSVHGYGGKTVTVNLF